MHATPEEAAARSLTITMTDIKQLFQNQGLKMTPFLVSVIIYFVFVREPHGELWTTALKCAPILCLMLYIILNGFQLLTQYTKYILWGLIFSCGGDALLNIDLFPHGMGLFALAQICYICAFGFQPVKWFIGVSLYIPGTAFVAIIFNMLDQILAVGLPIYVFLLLLMCWRSLARATNSKCFLKTFCGFGCVCFVISDALIGVDMFVTKVPHARNWIMLTYYLAQFAIALSTLNESGKKKSAKHVKCCRNSTT